MGRRFSSFLVAFSAQEDRGFSKKASYFPSYSFSRLSTDENLTRAYLFAYLVSNLLSLSYNTVSDIFPLLLLLLFLFVTLLAGALICQMSLVRRFQDQSPLHSGMIDA